MKLKHSQEPLVADAYIGKGQALHELGRYKDALEAFECAIALERVLEDTYYNFANAYLSKGTTLEAMGKNDEASTAYDKAIKAFDFVIYKQPDLAGHYYYDKGEALRDIGRTEDAVAAFKKAKKLEPEIFTYIPEIDGGQRKDG